MPLIAGRPALLRVFPTADAHTEATLPPARATLHPGSGAEGPHVVDIPAGAAAIPQQVREGRLDLSLNAEIPGSVVRPGLEMVVDLDPDGTLDSTLGVIKRVPEEGRLAVEVLEMPTFDVTVVPFLWAEDPDSAILGLTDGMTAEDTLFGDTRTLLPVADMTVTVHDPVVAETNVAWDLYQATDMIRTSEQGTGHYLGTMSGEVVGSQGDRIGRRADCLLDSGFPHHRSRVRAQFPSAARSLRRRGGTRPRLSLRRRLHRRLGIRSPRRHPRRWEHARPHDLLFPRLGQRLPLHQRGPFPCARRRERHVHHHPATRPLPLGRRRRARGRPTWTPRS